MSLVTCVWLLKNRTPVMTNIWTTRSALSRAHLPPTTVFWRLKTTRCCFDASTGPQYQYTCTGFSRRNKIPRCRVAVHTLWKKGIRFGHPDYDPDRAQKLTSWSMSRHLSTRNISSKSMDAFLSNLAHRQTDRQTNAGARAKTYTSSFAMKS